MLRAALPPHARGSLADSLARELAERGELVVEGTTARIPTFEAELSSAQGDMARALLDALGEVGLEGLTSAELAERRSCAEAADVLAFLAERAQVRLIADTFWVAAAALDRAIERIEAELEGREGLGPADFRSVLPLSRRRLIPILEHLDALGVTERGEAGRRVRRRRGSRSAGSPVVPE